MRATRNYGKKRAEHIRRNEMIRREARRKAEIRRKAEAEKRKRLAEAKAKKAAIQALKQRFLKNHASIELLEAELRRFSKLSGISKADKKLMSEKNFVQPTISRRKKDIAVEKKIKSITPQKQRYEMAKQKCGKLIREIDKLSQKEGQIRKDLIGLWGHSNFTEFIKRDVEPETWADYKDKEPPPSLWKSHKHLIQ